MEIKPINLKVSDPKELVAYSISKPLKDPTILMTGGCHVDHEGYDLNEIEQAFYTESNITLIADPTWYKDGGGDHKTNAVIQPWIEEVQNQPIESNKNQFILDHSMFVFRLPFTGEAANQIVYYSKQRPELLRLTSAKFKCGLDLCIDMLIYDDNEYGQVHPYLHIEWDYSNYDELCKGKDYINSRILRLCSENKAKTILQYNKTILAKKQRGGTAFEEADYRAFLVLEESIDVPCKAYRLIATL